MMARDSDGVADTCPCLWGGPCGRDPQAGHSVPADAPEREREDCGTPSDGPEVGAVVYATMDLATAEGLAMPVECLARVTAVEPEDATDVLWVVVSFFGNGMPEGVSVAWSRCRPAPPEVVATVRGAS